jgi:hypothetical protein
MLYSPFGARVSIGSSKINNAEAGSDRSSGTNCDISQLHILILRNDGCEIHLALLSPLQHLQPSGLGVFPTRRYEVTPCEGESLLRGFPGLKPWLKPWAEIGVGTK